MFQFVHVASSENYIVRFKSGDHAGHNICDIAPPFLLASVFECFAAHIVLVRELLVREVAQFHWLHNAVHNQGRTEARAQTEEQHLASLVAPQGLHRRIVHDSDRTAESSFKIKADPPGGQVMRVSDWTVLYDRSGIAHRDCVVFPVHGEPLYTGDHLLRRHGGAGGKLPRRILRSCKDLHVSSAHINCQHFHDEVSKRRKPAASFNSLLSGLRPWLSSRLPWM